MTIGVPIVTCLHRVCRIHKAAQTPLPRIEDLHHMCLGRGHSPSPVDRADCMCLHGRPCVWLPFAAVYAATLSSTYWWCLQLVYIVCQRPSSNFPYFRTPLANFLLSRPNSVEYCNSKTTTLLPSAKCTRPLFQGRTGCGGRPSRWHDIVTCQLLVCCRSTIWYWCRNNLSIDPSRWCGCRRGWQFQQLCPRRRRRRIVTVITGRWI